jgi:hypothetical protein
VWFLEEPGAEVLAASPAGIHRKSSSISLNDQRLKSSNLHHDSALNELAIRRKVSEKVWA